MKGQLIITKAKKTPYKGTKNADVFEIPKSVKPKVKKISINALAGDDRITVLGGTGHKINTGAGNDQVFLKKGNGHTVTLGTAKKKNTVTVTKGTKHIIKGSKKVDVLKISGGTVKKATLDKGNDIITVSKNGKLTTLKAGAGKNKLTVSGKGSVKTAGHRAEKNLRKTIDTIFFYASRQYVIGRLPYTILYEDGATRSHGWLLCISSL